MAATRLNPEYADSRLFKKTLFTVKAGASHQFPAIGGHGILVLTASGGNAILTQVFSYFYENRWGKQMASISRIYFSNINASNVTLTWGDEYGDVFQYLKLANGSASDLTVSVAVLDTLF